MKKILLLVIIFPMTYTRADVPRFDTLTQYEADGVANEFATNFIHTSVSPASSVGKNFGLEIGLIAGGTKSPKIDEITKKFSSSTSISTIPTSGILGVVALPLGLQGELNIIPKIVSNGYSLENTSVAAKWTFTSLIPNAPFDMAVRGFAGTGTLGFSNTVNNSSTNNQNVQTKMNWKSKSTGYNFSFSREFLFIELYGGFGKVKTTTDIGLSASTNVSIFTFSNASTYSSTNTGTHLFAGLNINIFFIKIGAEYSKIMGNSKYIGKFSLYF